MGDSIGDRISKLNLWKLSKTTRHHEDETKKNIKEKKKLESHGIGEQRDTRQ